MNYKSLVIEFFQASALAAVLVFLFAILGEQRGNFVTQSSFLALLIGGIPMMLVKRFIISFIKEIREK